MLVGTGATQWMYTSICFVAKTTGPSQSMPANGKCPSPQLYGPYLWQTCFPKKLALDCVLQGSHT